MLEREKGTEQERDTKINKARGGERERMKESEKEGERTRERE